MTDAASWAARLGYYEDVLAHSGIALIARVDGADAGYALAVIEPARWPATFAGGPVNAELASLAVRGELRGRGLGAALLAAVEARLDEAGIGDRIIGVVPGNTRAIELYSRRGYEPTWLALTRFGRPSELPAATIPEPIGLVAPDEVDALERLWQSLHAHHRAVAPGLGPFVSADASWAARRPLLATAAQAGLLLRAGPPEHPLGLACLTIARDDPMWADSWVTGRDVAEISVLAVEDSARAAGVASALLNAVDAQLAAAGVHDQAIGAVALNAAAIRLYEQHGFRPAYLDMTRFALRG